MNGSDEEEIVKKVREEQLYNPSARYTDHSFAANDASLYKDIDKIPEYADVEPRTSKGPHQWLYPEEFTEAPALFVEGTAAADVVQGQLGDCWLLGAMAAVASHKNKLIENLFLTPDEDIVEVGVITCQFYKNGEWVEVTTDTRIPYGDVDSEMFNFPVYGHALDKRELWVPLLEKAYAKLHGTYEHIHGGSVCDALVDLTGGVGEKILLTDPSVKELASSGRLWTKMTKYLEKGYLLGCSHSRKDGPFEQDAGNGILTNHAYSVLHMKQIGKRLRLLKIRNPWGKGEWNGDWSDDWEGWAEHPDIEAALMDDPECEFKRGEDGVFWMVWEDFIQYFNKVYLCRVFDESFNQYVVASEWRGKAAGGPPKIMWGASTANRRRSHAVDELDQEDIAGAETKEVEDTKRDAPIRPLQATERPPLTGMTVRGDGDSSWFLNPQIRVFLKPQAADPMLQATATFSATSMLSSAKPKKHKMLVSLSQEDPLLGGPGDDGNPKETVGIRFQVYKDSRPAGGPASRSKRLWESTTAELVADSSKANFANEFPQREVAKANIELEEGVSYVIVPFTSSPNVAKKFNVRIFSQSELVVQSLPEPYTLETSGKWTKETAGGHFRVDGADNPAWSSNPQFYLYLDHSSEAAATFSDTNAALADIAAGGNPSKPVEALRPGRGSKFANLKVVLRRTDRNAAKTDRTEGPRNCIGVAATRVDAAASEKVDEAEAAAAKRRARKLKPNALGEIKNTHVSLGKTLSSEVAREERELPSRRLELRPSEWCQSSDCSDPLIAVAYLRLPMDWLNEGILLHPFMRFPGREGRFQLQVFSELPMKLRELSVSNTQTLTSAWAKERTAFGCHLHEKWKRNPAFELAVSPPSNGSSPVARITLSRPEAHWRSLVKADNVGTMLGFYVVSCDKTRESRLHDGRDGMLAETAFVPMNSVSATVTIPIEQLTMEGKTVIIQPCTFDQNKEGPFHLTVSMESEFALRPYKPLTTAA